MKIRRPVMMLKPAVVVVVVLIFCPVIDSTNGAEKQTIVDVGDNVTIDNDGTIKGEIGGDIGELQSIKEIVTSMTQFLKSYFYRDTMLLHFKSKHYYGW